MQGITNAIFTNLFTDNYYVININVNIYLKYTDISKVLYRKITII